MPMPKQTFGGDDDTEEAPPEEPAIDIKKHLSKYAGSPDKNIRDTFWRVIEAYAKGEGKKLLPELESERFALMRIAIGVLGRPKSAMTRLSHPTVARYTIMMLLDAGWTDSMGEFLTECGESRGMMGIVLPAMRKLAKTEGYSEPLAETLRAMLRNRELSDTALACIGEIKLAELSILLKNELIILARGDIGANQHNAMKALAVIPDDGEARKTLLALLSHWDEETRLQAALLLKTMNGPDAAEAARRRLQLETDPEVKRALEKLAK